MATTCPTVGGGMGKTEAEGEELKEAALDGVRRELTYKGLGLDAAPAELLRELQDFVTRLHFHGTGTQVRKYIHSAIQRQVVDKSKKNIKQGQSIGQLKDVLREYRRRIAEFEGECDPPPERKVECFSCAIMQIARPWPSSMEPAKPQERGISAYLLRIVDPLLIFGSPVGVQKKLAQQLDEGAWLPSSAQLKARKRTLGNRSVSKTNLSFS